MDLYIDNQEETKEVPPSHYYGDITRKLFIVAGGIIILGMPFIFDYMGEGYVLLLIPVVLFGAVAGFSRPYSRVVAMANFVFSIAGVIFFEFAALDIYRKQQSSIMSLLTFQALAIISFLALYYSAKTVRGMSRK